MRQLLEDMEVDIVKKPTILFGDNVCANNLSREHFVSLGNQYIYRPYHFNREATRLGLIDVKWVKTDYNIADIFTKALAGQKLNHSEHGMLKYLLGYADVNQFKELLESILDQDAIKMMK